MAIGLFAALAHVQPAGAQRTKELDILQTSDTHSRIEPISLQSADRNAGLGGAARRAAFVSSFRKEHPDVLLFDCGDISQGTPYYNLFKGELEVKLMNLMQYDAMTIGNHEFDFGLDNMAHLFRMAHFPVVCANYDVTGTVLEGLVKPYTVIERGGMRIGVFGLSPKMEGLVQADKCAGITFMDPIPVARKVTAILRDEEHCDVVICLSHLGYKIAGDSDEELAEQTSGIDAILGGHTHTFMDGPDFLTNAEGKEVPVMHTGRNGVCVGHMKLVLMQE